MPHTHRMSNAPDENRRKKVRDFYEEAGLSCGEIGKILGVSRQAVRQLLIKQGITLRPTGGNMGGGRR